MRETLLSESFRARAKGSWDPSQPKPSQPVLSTATVRIRSLRPQPRPGLGAPGTQSASELFSGGGQVATQ